MEVEASEDSLGQLICGIDFADDAVIGFEVVGEFVGYVVGLLEEVSEVVLGERGECCVVGEVFDDLVVGDLVFF